MVFPASKNSNKIGNDLTLDRLLIVEEKLIKVNGEASIKKYTKGKFLGKVK